MGRCFVLSTTMLNVIPLNYKMNDIINKFLLVGDKFMPEIHLRQPGFTYSACGPFTKNKEKIQRFKIYYKTELDRACFQHDMAYGYFKDFKKRTAADKVLRDIAFNIAKDPKYDGYQQGLASIVYNFFDKELQVVVPLHLQINLLLNLYVKINN